MGSYRESSNKAKAIRAGIVDARPVSKSRTIKTKDWLIISISSRNISKDYNIDRNNYVGVIDISGEYTSEDIALNALPDVYDRYEISINHYLFGRHYIIHRAVYETIYKPLWRNLLEADILKNKLTKFETN